jgi:hypothetical protein
MIPLHLFRRQFQRSQLAHPLLYSALSGVFFFFPLDLIQVQGYSATEAGAALLPFILLMFLLSRWSGGLLDRYGAKAPLVVGPLIAAVGFALFARPRIGGAYWTTFFPAVLVLGLGMAISAAPLTTTVMNAAEQRYAGAASGSITPSHASPACWPWQFSEHYSAEFSRELWTGDWKDSPWRQAVRAQIEAQRSKLAAAETGDAGGRQAIAEAFVAGYRTALWVAVGLALPCSLSAAALISTERRCGA